MPGLAIRYCIPTRIFPLSLSDARAKVFRRARGRADTYHVHLAQAGGGLAWAGPLWVELA